MNAKLAALRLAVPVALAAILAHFLYWHPPDLIGAARAAREQLVGDWEMPIHSCMALLTVLAMWFAASGTGLLALELGGARETLASLWQRTALGALVGWVALSLATLLLGLAGFADRASLGALLLAFALLAIRGWSGVFAENAERAEARMEVLADGPEPGGDDGGDGEQTGLSRGAGSDPLSDMMLPPAALAVLLVLYVIALPYAATPAVESDELRYHLAAPEAWLASGHIHYLPYQAFSNFPFLVEMLFMMAMALQGTEAARLVHLSFLETTAVFIALTAYLLAALALRGAGERRAPRARAAAALAGAAFAAMPAATMLACWAFVDVAAAAYAAGFVYLGALALSARRPPPAWLIGAIAGGAVGVKYSMIPLLAALAPLLFALVALRARASRVPVGEAVHYAALAALVAMIVAAPWLAKDFVWTGNPIYPMAWSIFGGGEWSEANAQFWAAKNAEKGFRVEGPAPPLARAAEFLASPVTTSIAWQDFENHFLGPLALMAMALAAAGAIAWLMTPPPPGGRRAAPELRGALAWILCALAVQWVLWFVTFQSARLLLPALALVFALAGAGGAVLVARVYSAPEPGAAGAFGSGVARALVAFAFLYSAGFSAAQVWGVKRPLGAALGFERREMYLARSIGYYPSARWIEGKLGPESRALLVGEHRTLYFPNDVVASDWFDTPQPLPLIRAAGGRPPTAEMLRKQGIRYLFFNRGELDLYRERYFRPRFTPEEYAAWTAFMSDPMWKLAHEDAARGIYILELAEPEA